MRHPPAGLLAAFALAMACAACNDDAGDSPSDQAPVAQGQHTPAKSQTVGVLSDAARYASSKRLKLSSCPGAQTLGGFDGRVAGIACDQVGGHFLALRAPIGRYNESQEAVYRPRAEAVAEWTCWARFDTRDDEIRHVCWNDGAIVLFKVA